MTDGSEWEFIYPVSLRKDSEWNAHDAFLAQWRRERKLRRDYGRVELNGTLHYREDSSPLIRVARLYNSDDPWTDPNAFTGEEPF